MKYYFFDLDGTLADTDRDIRESWKATLVDLGLDCPNFDRDFVAGPPIDEMAKQLFPERFSPALADAIRVGFARHYDTDGLPNTVPYPEAVACAKALKARGDFVAIVTNKRYVGATAVVKKFGWETLFDALHTGDMDLALGVPNGKKLRKTDLLKRVIADLRAPLEDCVMVGDTKSDFEAAAYCGIRSVGVTWGYGTEAELAQATRIVGPETALAALLAL